MNILVVGAGIAGLTFTRLCERFPRLSITLIEQRPNWPQDNAGICLPANAMLGFTNIHLDKAILKQAHQVYSVEYALSNGKTLSRASLREAPLSKAPFVCLPRSTLLELLREGLSTSVQFNTTVRKASLLKDNSVEVTLDNDVQQIFDLVVAADGINSSIRAMRFPDAVSQDMGVTCWRFCVETNTENLQPIYFLGKDSIFMLYPMGNNKVYCYAHVIDFKMRYPCLGPRFSLNEIFSGYCEQVVRALDSIQALAHIHVGRLQSVPRLCFHDGRIVFIGDALHGCPPSLQQGVGMAVEDCVTLSSLLIAQETDQALSSFVSRRKQRVQWVLDESNDIIRRAIKGRSFVSNIVRNYLIRKKGPANIVGWRSLLQQNPYVDLDMNIFDGLATEHSTKCTT